MNAYTKNLNRLEFMMTLACTGRCKHCSQGNHENGVFIDCDAAIDVVRKVTSQYPVRSLMTFGGEPLLQWNTVCKVHAAAREAGIPERSLITNGYFTKDSEQIRLAAQELGKSGVSEIMLSVDAFHQETVPLEIVKQFAKALQAENMDVHTHPAWLESSTAENPYNEATRKILREFEEMGITASEGNVIFPEGNALVYLKEYFDKQDLPVNPYTEDPQDIRSICIGPDGDVLGENIYRKDILQILEEYLPNTDRNGMAKIILLCGKICSGKTYYAGKLLENSMAVLLSCDEFTKMIFDNDLGKQHDAVMVKVKKYLLKKALEIYACGMDVILDWGFWTEADRAEISRIMQDNHVLFEWHYIDASDKRLRENIAIRNRSVEQSGSGSDYYVDEGLLEKCLSQFEEPDRSEMDVWHRAVRETK